MKNKSNTLLLPVILAVALALRISGITHGFPFIFHPDEPSVIRSALALRFYLNPGHFDWPHLILYLNYYLYMGFSLLRNVLHLVDLQPFISKIFPLMWNDELIFYFLSRALTAVLGALTVIPVYLAGRDTFGKRVGILSALAFAFIPFHVRHSHYALVDVPMVFFLAWGMFFALNILKRRDMGDYSGAGFYIGLAASTKYNGGLSLLTVPLAHLIRVVTKKEKFFDFTSISYMFLAFITSIIGFLMGTPYALLDFQTFLIKDSPKGALWQFTNVGAIPLGNRFSEFINEMIYKVSDDLGYIILIVFFTVVLLQIIRLIAKTHAPENSALWFLITSALFLLIYVSGFSRSRSHYYMIAYPYIAVVYGYFVNIILTKLELKHKFLELVFFLLFFILPLYMSVKTSFTFYNSDTRSAVYTWLLPRVNKSDLIYFNDSNVSMIPVKLGIKSTKLAVDTVSVDAGYFLVSYYAEADLKKFPFNLYGDKLTLVARADNNFRSGPKVDVYTFNK